MFFSIPDFEKLHSEGRIKFIEIRGEIFIYNVKENYLMRIENPGKFFPEVVKALKNPVKTLILHTTYECNLKCRHCYINAGEKRDDEMSICELSRIVREFGEMGGLTVDLSGGEAFLKEGIEEVIQTARKQKLRTFVLSNAVNLDDSQLRRVSSYLDGIVVGLDGFYKSNDDIRGKGSFEKTLRGIEKIAREGIELSVTTLITPQNIHQLDQFPKFISKYGGKEWSLVMPRTSGRFKDEDNVTNESYRVWEEAKRKGLLKDLQEQAKKYQVEIVLDHLLVPGAKKRIEENSKDFIYNAYNKGRACWDNTLTVMPNGDVKCCLFFEDQVYDNVRRKSLREVYESPKREKALEEFRKYPVDKCPFVEKANLRRFNSELKTL